MKNTGLILGILLLAAVTGVQAQSGGGALTGNTGQQGSSPQNNGRKANTSQTMGKGVPYSKDAEQKSRIKAKQAGDATTGATGDVGRKQGGKLSKKGGTASSGKATNQ